MTSKASRRKGKFDRSVFIDGANSWRGRFGWVNASYVYGLQIVNAHMRRALGTLTPYPTFIRAIELNDEKALANLQLG